MKTTKINRTKKVKDGKTEKPRRRVAVNRDRLADAIKKNNERRAEQ